MPVFRQLFDTTSSTYTYLLGDPGSGEALLIDPVFEHAQRDAALLRELGLHLVATLDTHVHADHLSVSKKESTSKPDLFNKLVAVPTEYARTCLGSFQTSLIGKFNNK